MRAAWSTTSSRAVMEPLTTPASRAVSASIRPWMVLASPWTSEAHWMSPSTRPSMCKSAVALTSPLMVMSEPITEKVLDIGLERPPAWLGGTMAVCAGFFESMGGGLQGGARSARASGDADLEVQVRTGRTSRAADQSDYVTRRNLRADMGAEA